MVSHSSYKAIQALKWTTIATNVYIFAKWHIPVTAPSEDARSATPPSIKPVHDPATPARLTARHQYMVDHYTTSLRNLDEGRYYTLLTPAFSHQNPGHLFVNMYVLHSATNIAAVVGLGPLRLTALALTSALGGSVAHVLQESRMHKDRREHGTRAQGAHGASAMVQGILVATACAAPLLPVNVMFIPIPIAYRTVVGAFMAWDLYGFYESLSTEGKAKKNWMGLTVAYGAHLGGAVAGAAFYFVAMRRGRAKPFRRL